MVLERSLVDGRYALVIDASKVNVEGFPIGGGSVYNLIGSATGANAGMIGSNYISEESDNRKIWRLFGDVGHTATSPLTIGNEV